MRLFRPLADVRLPIHIDLPRLLLHVLNFVQVLGKFGLKSGPGPIK